MSDSRGRFDAWIKSEAKARPAFRLDPAYVWQAAEAEAARACVDHINGHSTVGDRSEQMIAAIRTEFPEAWK